MSPDSTCSSKPAAGGRPRLVVRGPRRRAVELALVALTAVLVPAAAAHAQGARDRQRAMYVTVTDQNGAPVTGLAPGDFVVREDGVQREVLRVEPATEPIEITLVLDTSEAATPIIADLRRAVTEFVKQMAKGNEIALTTMGGRPTIVQNYTANVELLNRAVGRLFAENGSGAYLLEALSSVAAGIKKREPERAAIVAVLMRSGPEFSGVPYLSVIENLRDCGATFDAFVVDVATPPPAPRGEQATAIHDRDAVLDEASRATGGVNEQVLSSMGLVAQLNALAAQLRNQYHVVYARPESLIPPQKVEISVKRAGLTARGTPVRARRSN